VAERAGVGTLVLSHLVPGDVDAVHDSEWRRRAQAGFSGKVVVGRDLMQLGVGKRG
jgi:ribonuclease BN (tRNA processing enzyme)